MSSKSLQEKVLEHIMSSHFSCEVPVREVDLAKIFGVSVTPVREALNNLEGKGFVERRKGKGTYLKPFHLKELCELYDLRSVLEGLAARLLCGVITPDVIRKLKTVEKEYKKSSPRGELRVLAEIDYRFHSLIVESCRNERLAALVKDFHIIAKTLKNSSSGRKFVRPFGNPYTHTRIIRAVESMDAEEAERVAKKHVELTKEHLVKIMLAEGVYTLGAGNGGRNHAAQVPEAGI